MKKYKLILAIMCTGVLVLTGCGGTSSSTTNVTGQEEQATQEETTKEDKENDTAQNTSKPSVELVDSYGGKFQDYFGDTCVSFWASYKNTSDVSVKLTDVDISYYDDDDSLLGADDMVQCIPEVILPGETGYVYSYYYSLAGVNTDNGVKPKIHYDIEEADKPYTVDVEDYSFKAGSSLDIEISVLAKNNSGMDITMANPGAVFFDEEGKAIGFCYGVESFSVNEEKTFNISGDMMAEGMDPSKVTSVQVFIQGDNSF